VASGDFSLAAFLSDYVSEIKNVDPLCSVHNFIAHSKYSTKMRPSPVVFEESIKSVERARLVLFPKPGPSSSPS
jgi:hypothetical protein